MTVFEDKVEKSITLKTNNDGSALRAVPAVDRVPELYVTFFNEDVPRIVFLFTVIKSWALLVRGKEQEPGGVKEL